MAIVFNPDTGVWDDLGGDNTPDTVPSNDPGAVFDLPDPNTPAGPGTNPMTVYSREAFLNIVSQIDPKNWWNDYKRFKSQFDAWGIKPQIASDGTFRGRFTLPGGENFDPWQSGYSWDTAPGTGGGGGNTIDPTYLAPWDETFDPGSDSELPELPGDPGMFEYADFQAPTGQSILDDPGYQFRQKSTLGALMNQKSALGLTGSGGTAYDFGKLSSDFASQEYGNAWNRGFTEWDREGQNKFGAWNANNQVKKGMYDMALERSNTARDRAWSNYLNRQDVWYRNQNEPFKKLSSIASLGAGLT